MSDFSEICPLFNTGVFRELLFPTLSMDAVSLSANALDNITPGDSQGVFVFSRTVVVTAGWIRKMVQPSATIQLSLKHLTSCNADATEIGSIVMLMTVSGQAVKQTWCPMTVTETTFTSAAGVGLSVGTYSATVAGVYDLMLRYKEA